MSGYEDMPELEGIEDWYEHADEVDELMDAAFSDDADEDGE